MIGPGMSEKGAAEEKRRIDPPMRTELIRIAKHRSSFDKFQQVSQSFGLVQKRVFWGNTVGSVREGQGGWRQVCGKSVTVEPAMAQEFEPVLMRPPGEEFRRAAADSFGAIAPREPPVVQEEPQQVQIPIADLPPQEEVAA